MVKIKIVVMTCLKTILGEVNTVSLFVVVRFLLGASIPRKNRDIPYSKRTAPKPC